MPDSRATLPALLLTTCLLAGFSFAPAQAQGTAGETVKITDAGRFPAIDADHRGGFVLAWTNVMDSNQEIHGGLLAPERNTVSPLFVVNTRTAGIQTYPQVAAGPRGDFMVVWQGGLFGIPAGGDGDREGVFGQTFSRNGTKLGTQRRLSQGTAGPQVSPIVAALEDGSFVAVWQDQRTLRFEIVMRRFAANGEPLGPEVPMKVGGEYNYVSGVAAYPGGFAVAWTEGFECSAARPNGSFGAVARFDLSGRPVGRVFRAGSFACGLGSEVAALAASPAGALAVLRTPGGYAMQRFSPSGGPVGRPALLSRGPICTEDLCSFLYRIAMDDRGRFAVLWDVYDATTRHISAQVFTPRGRPVTDRIPVTSLPRVSFSTPDVALTNQGTLGVTWHGENEEDPEERGLFIWRYRLP